MPRISSGDRVGRSFVSPTGAGISVGRVLDFQLGPDDGIEIVAVLGYGYYFDNTPATSDTVPAANAASQTLHLEEGALEVIDLEAAEDDDDIDSEIFYVQNWAMNFQVPATAGGGGGGVTVTPSGLVTFAKPILSPRNITHNGRTTTADTFLQAGILLYYHYVRFTSAELGVLLARR